MAARRLGSLKERLMVTVSAGVLIWGLMMMNEDFHRRVNALVGPQGSTEIVGITGRVQHVAFNLADQAHYYTGENMFMVVFAVGAFVMLIVMLKT